MICWDTLGSIEINLRSIMIHWVPLVCMSMKFYPLIDWIHCELLGSFGIPFGSIGIH